MTVWILDIRLSTFVSFRLDFVGIVDMFYTKYWIIKYSNYIKIAEKSFPLISIYVIFDTLELIKNQVISSEEHHWSKNERNYEGKRNCTTEMW